MTALSGILTGTKFPARLHARQTGWIGVDLGTAALKLAQVERRGWGFQLAAGTVIPYERLPALHRDSIADLSLSRLVRHAVEDADGFDGKSAACVLSMSATELRTMDLPDGTEEELRSIVAGELTAEDEIRASDTEFELWHPGDDVEPAEIQPPGPKTYHVLATSRSLAEEFAAGLLAAGLRCEVLDALPFALARATAMMRIPRGKDNVTAALDWGRSSATLALCRGGVPLFTRTLRDCGTDRLYEALKSGLGLTESEGRQCLAEYGIPAQRDSATGPGAFQSMISDMLSAPLAQLLGELTRTLQYLSQKHPELYPGSFCLFGAGAAVRNAAEFLSRQAGLPARVWSLPWKNPERDNPQAGAAPLLGSAAALSALVWQL